MEKFNLIFVIVLLIVGSPSINASEKILNSKVFDFDESQKISFRCANSLLLNNGKVFLLENLGQQILKFKTNGNQVSLIGKIGKRGKGPGDINLPVSIMTENNLIVVRDNEGVSIFTQDGEFLSKFRVFSRYISSFFLKGRYFQLSANPNSKNLIEMYSGDGKKEKDIFLKFLNIDISKNKKINPFFQELYFYNGRIFSNSKYIYYLNTKFGIIMKMDFSGKVLSKVLLEPFLDEKAVSIIQKNLDLLRNGIQVTFSSNGGMIIPSFDMVKDAYLFNDKLFLIGDEVRANKSDKKDIKRSDSIFIRSIDLEKMTVLDSYTIKLNCENCIQSFAVSEDEDGIFFVVAQEMEDGVNLVRYYERDRK